jgi:hypothetical protein
LIENVCRAARAAGSSAGDYLIRLDGSLAAIGSA